MMIEIKGEACSYNWTSQRFQRGIILYFLSLQRVSKMGIFKLPFIRMCIYVYALTSSICIYSTLTQLSKSGGWEDKSGDVECSSSSGGRDGRQKDEVAGMGGWDTEVKVMVVWGCEVWHTFLSWCGSVRDVENWWRGR